MRIPSPKLLLEQVTAQHFAQEGTFFVGFPCNFEELVTDLTNIAVMSWSKKEETRPQAVQFFKDE